MWKRWIVCFDLGTFNSFSLFHLLLLLLRLLYFNFTFWKHWNSYDTQFNLYQTFPVILECCLPRSTTIDQLEHYTVQELPGSRNFLDHSIWSCFSVWLEHISSVIYTVLIYGEDICMDIVYRSFSSCCCIVSFCAIILFWPTILANILQVWQKRIQNSVKHLIPHSY